MYTPLDFDRPRNLRFDIAACEDLETRLSASLGEIIIKLNQLSVTTTIAALWAGCKHEDPTLTIALVRKRLQTYLDQGGRLRDINEALNKALVDSTPLKTSKDAEESEGNAAPEPAAIG